MVKVELEYNPYLMETIVRFDGREPRINSLVEKYQNSKLQDWIREIPDIFYNEMNGYGFELEFSGTKMDFEQLKKVFEDAGITENQVVLFHKNEIDSREEKVNALSQLIEWLSKEENNGVFDEKAFFDEYNGKLNEEYTFITLNGRGEAKYFDEFNISVEDIDSTDELKDVTLSNIPIIVFVTRELVPSLQRIILDLKQRDDVEENQLFFILSDELDEGRVKRTIRDLGVRHLQIVPSAYDAAVKDYYYAYPVTDHLHDVLQILKNKSQITTKVVEKRKAESEGSNKEIQEHINRLDDTLESLKKALERLKHRDNLEMPDACVDAQIRLKKSIESWRKNKVKIPIEYAERNALEFNEDLRRYYKDFILEVNSAISVTRKKVLKSFKSIYAKAGYDNYEAKCKEEKIEQSVAPFLMKSLLELKEEKYVSPKADLVDIIFKDSDRIKGPDLVVTYYLQDWRKCALEAFVPLAKNDVMEQYDQLKESLDMVAEDYISHIGEAIENERKKKELITSQLSTEELCLQSDIDWNTTLLEKIGKLERA